MSKVNINEAVLAVSIGSVVDVITEAERVKKVAQACKAKHLSTILAWHLRARLYTETLKCIARDPKSSGWARDMATEALWLEDQIK